jgi:NADH dehydrogenase FAD-containing subunit
MNSTGLQKNFPRIVIVGGGFGGLAAAKALKHTPARITLIDRSNHHLFQPLLYQVATSTLTPGQIAAPIREVLRKQQNSTVMLGEVTSVD